MSVLAHTVQCSMRYILVSLNSREFPKSVARQTIEHFVIVNRPINSLWRQVGHHPQRDRNGRWNERTDVSATTIRS